MDKSTLEKHPRLNSLGLPRTAGPSGLRLVLASASPRRSELIALTGWPVALQPVEVDETPRPGEDARGVTRRLAVAKAVAARRNSPPGAVILAADTIVADDQGVLGKPGSDAEAQAILQRLRGRRHLVVSSLAVIGPDGFPLLEDSCATEVPMRGYSRAEVVSFVASGAAGDKAGAYSIQDPSFRPVDETSLEGCYANVMGLPLCHVVRTLRRRGIEPAQDVPSACQAHTGYACPVYERILKGES
jgi:septum formation protein